MQKKVVFEVDALTEISLSIPESGKFLMQVSYQSDLGEAELISIPCYFNLADLDSLIEELEYHRDNLATNKSRGSPEIVSYKNIYKD